MSGMTDENRRSQVARKTTLVSVVVNLFLSSAQVLAGVFCGSQGLIADGIHSLSDLVADFVVLLANKKSRQPSDDDHPYGHWRYENGASLAIGALLLLVGAGMLWSACGKLWHPESIQNVHITALWVALAALVAKEVLFRYMLRAAKQIHSSMLIANAWHARSDAASSVVVAVGIIGNLAGFAWLDPVAALVVGALVTRMGYTFSSDALHDLMDRSVDRDTEQQITATILATPGVAALHDLKTRRAGDFILVDVHIEVPGNLSVAQGHDIALTARSRVLRKVRISGEILLG
ncbi:cation diffusion facilitator family transporter [Klebsiella grimontii]|uniref:cation diffusion facilitator family transporter n=1 Tax=Klebsiella grimontii TaxID=2058152 RepID=UPI00292C2E88|nr:cation diffusion facilitator family transporter [Klebsiella grimontii]MDV1015877.1 cation diffusion facilitator family transporter [Klebsiella grimontii]MDV1026586.1 cation diffusion facilitator family transporter [Klebsiella grimontii]MDV1043132.1 cation diffusion facilitator family transporter [Klebsiella grimontii]MDV1107600.1 cation diffusion facilitator family transporter [Klebsiella grimontii]MDV1117932.1 cation diffusion facilitator family transporter [Klebsiella grimontii]